MTERNFQAQLFINRTIQHVRRTGIDLRGTQQFYALASISCATKSHPAQIKSLRRELESTQDSLNMWDEVGDSIGTSISSVSSVTEAAINHPPQVGRDPKLFQLKEHPVSGTKIGCSFEYATGEQFEKSTGSTQFIFSCNFLPAETASLTVASQSQIMEDPKRGKPNKLLFDKQPQPTEIASWKISFKSEITHSSQRQSSHLGHQRCIESSIKERQRSSLRHKVERSIISSHWQTYWQHIGESAQDASWKVGRLEICVASLQSRDDIRRQQRRLLQIEVDGPKASRAENQGFSFRNEKSRRGRTDLQQELRAKEKRQEKAKTTPKTIPREETANFGLQKANQRPWEMWKKWQGVKFGRSTRTCKKHFRAKHWSNAKMHTTCRYCRTALVRNYVAEWSSSKTSQDESHRVLSFCTFEQLCLAAREVLFLHVYPGASTLDIKKHNQTCLNGRVPESFEDRIIILSMFNYTDWTESGNPEICLHNAKEVAAFAAEVKPGHQCFLALAPERMLWNGKPQNTQGHWYSIASDRTIVAWTLEEKELNSHFHGTFDTKKILIKTIVAGQLTVYLQLHLLPSTSTPSSWQDSRKKKKKNRNMSQAGRDSMQKLTAIRETLIHRASE